MGPRRVGKTVLVYQMIQSLLDSGISGTSVLYASLETPVYSKMPLEKILGMFQSRFVHKREAPLYVFFDEVQYLRDWEIHLKSLVDSYPACHFVVTGLGRCRTETQEPGIWGRAIYRFSPPSADIFGIPRFPIPKRGACPGFRKVHREYRRTEQGVLQLSEFRGIP